MRTKLLELRVSVLIDAKIPRRFWELGPETFSGNMDALQTCMRFVKTVLKSLRVNGSCDSLVIQGHECSGKTFLGTFILKCLLSRNYGALYTTLSDLGKHHLGQETDTGFRNLYGSGTQVLFVDDIERTQHKGEINALQRLVKIRADSGLATIFATSLNKTEVIEVFGHRTNQGIFNFAEAVDCSSEAMLFELSRKQAERQNHAG